MSKEQCGHCGRSFARLGQHFFHNPDCSAFASKRAGTKQMCVTSEEYEIVENSTDEESAEDDSPFLALMDEESAEDDSPFVARMDDAPVSPANGIIQQRTVGHTKAMKWETKLLKILNDANTPHYLVSDILEWASGAAVDGYSFPSVVPTRTTLIRNIGHHWTGSQYIVRPKQTMVPCPARPGLSIPVVWFDFLEQLRDLLSCQTLFGDLANLDVNPNDPYEPYCSPSNKIDCMNAGS